MCGQTTEIIELRKWIVLFSVKIDGWFRDLVHCTKSNCFVVLAAVKVFNLTVAYSADKSYWTMKRMREVVNSWSDSVNSLFGLLPSELSIAISVLVLINRLKLQSRVNISQKKERIKSSTDLFGHIRLFHKRVYLHSSI